MRRQPVPMAHVLRPSLPPSRQESPEARLKLHNALKREFVMTKRKELKGISAVAADLAPSESKAEVLEDCATRLLPSTIQRMLSKARLRSGNACSQCTANRGLGLPRQSDAASISFSGH
jgi:hypothetical protein